MALDKKIVYKVNDDLCFLYYKRHFLNTERIKNILTVLENEDRWKTGKTYYGTMIKRKQIWCQSEGKYFSKSWKSEEFDRWKSQTYHGEIKKLQDYIQEYLSENIEGIKIPHINSVLINRYDNGNDIIKPHRDNLSTFGDSPTVIIISLGEERNINFQPVVYDKDNVKKSKHDKSRYKQKNSIKLEQGSMFIMAGDTQKHFLHSIDKDDTKNVRYSLTFREYV